MCKTLATPSGSAEKPQQRKLQTFKVKDDNFKRRIQHLGKCAHLLFFAESR